MQEIAGTKPLNFHVAMPQVAVRPPVTMVAAGMDTGASGTASDGRTPGDSRHPGTSPAPADPRNPRPDRFTLTGPSPAFQASLLEVERGFRNALARIEATRAKAEVDELFGRSAKADAAKAEPAQAAAAGTKAKAEADAVGKPTPGARTGTDEVAGIEAPERSGDLAQSAPAKPPEAPAAPAADTRAEAPAPVRAETPAREEPVEVA